ELELYDAATGTMLAHGPTQRGRDFGARVAMPTADLIRVESIDEFEEWSAEPLKQMAIVTMGMGVGQGQPAFSANFDAFVANALGSLLIYQSTADRAKNQFVEGVYDEHASLVEASLPIGRSDALTISDDGRRVAAAAGGVIYVASADPRYS